VSYEEALHEALDGLFNPREGVIERVFACTPIEMMGL
jgi:hypothetical protein